MVQTSEAVYQRSPRTVEELETEATMPCVPVHWATLAVIDFSGLGLS